MSDKDLKLIQEQSNGSFLESNLSPVALYVMGFDSSKNPVLFDKQNVLISGINIKTINGGSILGSGDIIIDANETDPVFAAWLLATPPLYSFTETDPIFTAHQAANITATDITNLGNLSGENTGDQDLSDI